MYSFLFVFVEIAHHSTLQLLCLLIIIFFFKIISFFFSIRNDRHVQNVISRRLHFFFSNFLVLSPF